MLLQLTLALVLLALPGSLQQDGHCTESKVRDVRLRGGTEYAGRVQVCWGENGPAQIVYKWQSVCDHLWGIEEARVVCNQLDYTNSTAAGLLLCGAECFGQGTGTQVQLSCPKDESCTINSILVLPCSETRSQEARVICAIPETTTAVEILAIVGGVLGGVIITMVVVLVGTNLCWAWFHHRTGKRKVSGEIATPDEAQVCNPTYDIPIYNKTSHTESHTQSVKDNATSFDNSSGVIPASAISCNPLINGEELMYHTLEGPTSMENTGRSSPMLDTGEMQDQDYATITGEDEVRKNYVALTVEDTSTINCAYSKLQYK